ncbi:MAG TPA: outer membrane protein [Pseudolabrys sp.]|jgi:outer membrane immunogenic protein|nr:outer membrane protein [Pseudolabrys sp.]
MKRIVLALAAATALTASAAIAADLPPGPAPYYGAQATGYNWAGLYAGLNAGYEWGKVTNTAGNPSGLAGGVQAGYNWQSGQFVFGGETDIQLSGADDTFAPYKFSNPWFGTLRARAGYAMNNILFYGTLGLAYGDLKGQLSGLDETKTEFGWTGGLGMEVGLAPNWSAKVEYLYMDLGSRTFSITGSDDALRASMLRFGVNYHF